MLAMGVMATVSLPLSAQEDEVKKNELVLDDVIVTSKRASALEQLDQQIAVISNDEITQSNVQTIEALNNKAPGLVLRQRGASIYNNVTLRGQSSQDFYSPKTLIYVDGLPQDFGVFAQSLPKGIRQIDVLNGPQGTLYGAGAVGGVVNIVTEKPGEGHQLTLDSAWSNLKQTVSGRFNQALIDDALYFDLSGSYLSRDGEYREAITHDDIGGGLNKQAQARLRWAPESSPWDILFTARHDNISSTEEQYVTKADFHRRTAFPVEGEYQLRLDSYGLTANYDASTFRATSLTSYQDRDLDRIVFSSDLLETRKSFTQEFRVASQPNALEQLSYIGGVYYENTDFTTDRPAYPQLTKQNRETYALFGELTWYLSEKWDLTPGLRVQSTEVKNDATFMTLSAKSKEQFDSVSPKLSLGYQLNDQTRVYALYSQGTKPGGFTRFSTPQTVSFSYDPEKVENYELGMKGNWFGGRLVGSAALYYTGTDDYQLFVGAQPFQYLDNVGKTKVKGLSLDADWKATDHWLIQFMLAYNDAQFSQYEGGGADYTGNQTPYVPKSNITLATTYGMTLPADLGKLSLYASANFNGKMYFDEANALSQDGFTLINTSLKWQPKQNVSVNLYANNLTDKDYAVYGFSAAGLGEFYQLGQGREVGVQVGLNY